MRDQLLTKSCFMPDSICLDSQFCLCLLSFVAKQTFWRINFHPCWCFSEQTNRLSIEALVPNVAKGFESLKLFFHIETKQFGIVVMLQKISSARTTHLSRG